MFGFNKKKEFTLVAPVTGTVIALAQVPDQVFSAKMLGEGVAIEPTISADDGTEQKITVVAPCDGELTLVPDTRHAFAITGPYGVEVLVHIGLDTVNLNGEGFKQLKEQGDKVKAVEPIIEFDSNVLKAHKLSAVTPMVLTNGDQIASLEVQKVTDAQAGKTMVLKGVIK
jgi:PTS system D-glucosamine-specific IIA component/PTS system glucose-specific IIA component